VDNPKNQHFSLLLDFEINFRKYCKYISIFAGKYVRHSAAECATTGPGIKPSDWHISTLKSVDSLNSQQYPFKGLKRHKKKIGRSLKQPVYTFYSEFSIFFAIH
jgi:hypothetical protein